MRGGDWTLPAVVFFEAVKSAIYSRLTSITLPWRIIQWDAVIHLVPIPTRTLRAPLLETVRVGESM